MAEALVTSNFHRADSDQDGYLSVAELWSTFDAFDANSKSLNMVDANPVITDNMLWSEYT